MSDSRAHPTTGGYLHLAFERDSRGVSLLREWERRAPIIVQRALYFDEMMPQMPCVYILSSGGPVIDGDNLRQSLIVRREASAHISTGAATKISRTNGRGASMVQDIRIEDGGYMEYLPEPEIPSRSAQYQSDTHIAIAPSATLVMSEIYLCGRRHYSSGERFVYERLSLLTEASRLDGEPLFRDRSVICPQRHGTDGEGVMCGWDIFASLYILTPKSHADALYASFRPYIDRNDSTALGVVRLPNSSGLLLRILGNESQRVKQIVREICSEVRKEIKGVGLANDFPWR